MKLGWLLIFFSSQPVWASELPDKCWADSSDQTCAVMTIQKKPLNLSLDVNKIYLSAGSALQRRSHAKIRYLSGVVRVEVQKSMRVETEYGSFDADQAEFVLWRDDNRVWVGVISGSIALTPRAETQAFAVDAGCENYLGAVNPSGQTEVDSSRAVLFKDFLQKWSQTESSKKLFTLKAQAFAVKWKTSVRQIASLDNARAVERRALLLREEAERAARLDQEKKKRDELRAVFRKHSLDE